MKVSQVLKSLCCWKSQTTDSNYEMPGRLARHEVDDVYDSSEYTPIMFTRYRDQVAANKANPGLDASVNAIVEDNIYEPVTFSGENETDFNENPFDQSNAKSKPIEMKTVKTREARSQEFLESVTLHKERVNLAELETPSNHANYGWFY